jgi:formylglycine-generating enzyme required for sulfatase activity
MKAVGRALTTTIDSWRGPRSRTRRVIGGCSFPCNQDYCLSHRPSARRGNDPFNSMNHIGFRLVQDAGPAANTIKVVNQ